MCANDGWVALSFIEMNHKLLMKICKAMNPAINSKSLCYELLACSERLCSWLKLGPQPTYMQGKDDHLLLPPPPLFPTLNPWPPYFQVLF